MFANCRTWKLFGEKVLKPSIMANFQNYKRKYKIETLHFIFDLL